MAPTSSGGSAGQGSRDGTLQLRSVLARFARYLRPYRGRLVVMLGTVALISGLELVRPWPLKIIVDSVLGERPLGFAHGSRLGKQELLIAACLATVFLQIALASLRVLLNRGTIGVGQDMVADLRAELVAHLQRLSLGFFGRRSAGDLVYRVTYDTLSVQSMAMNGFFPLVSALVLLVGMTAVMIRMNPMLAAIFLAVVPLLFLAIRSLGGRISLLAQQTREHESRFLSEAQRGVGAMPVVQAFTAEDLEHARVMRASSQALSSARRLNVLETGYTGVVNVLIALGTAAVLFAGGMLGLSARLTAGELIVFVSYLGSLYVPINSLSQIAARLQRGSASARRVFELLDQEPEVRDAPDARAIASARGELRFERVGFAYPEGSFALREISFDAEPGARLALVGRTGAGKTTVASLIPRFHDPSTGRILLDGVDLRAIRLRSLREQIGVVPQAPLLFPASLRDNILYGRREASDEEVRSAATIAGVTGFAEELPQGFATPVGPEGVALSQGQMQRITIARALLRDPSILILDEPTSALDPETEAYVMRSLAAAMHGRTTLVIAHRLATVRSADLVLVLERGAVVESGSYESLRHAGGPFQRLHDAHLLSGSEADREPPRGSRGVAA